MIQMLAGLITYILSNRPFINFAKIRRNYEL